MPASRIRPATIGFLRCNMNAPMLERMLAIHLLRACLLIVAALLVLPIQVQDAAGASVSASVLRDCSERCGVKARALRPDSVRRTTVSQAPGQTMPDDGFVPIPALGPSLASSLPAFPFHVDRSRIGAALQSRLERPPKLA